jgi:hypothetical protein
MHSTMISRSKCRPLNRSSALILSIIAQDSNRMQTLHQNPMKQLITCHRKQSIRQTEQDAADCERLLVL